MQEQTNCDWERWFWSSYSWLSTWDEEHTSYVHNKINYLSMFPVRSSETHFPNLFPQKHTHSEVINCLVVLVGSEVRKDMPHVWNLYSAKVLNRGYEVWHFCHSIGFSTETFLVLTPNGPATMANGISKFWSQMTPLAASGPIAECFLTLTVLIVSNFTLHFSHFPERRAPVPLLRRWHL